MGVLLPRHFPYSYLTPVAGQSQKELVVENIERTYYAHRNRPRNRLSSIPLGQRVASGEMAARGAFGCSPSQATRTPLAPQLHDAPVATEDPLGQFCRPGLVVSGLAVVLRTRANGPRTPVLSCRRCCQPSSRPGSSDMIVMNPNTLPKTA